MKKINNLALSIFLLSSFHASAQAIVPDLTEKTKWTVHNRTAEAITERDKKGVSLSEASGDGLMILKDIEFADGTIEVDLKGRNVPQRSFVGLAFHIKQPNTYDAIYFRPFNFVNPDTARRVRAVQYVSMPGYPWEKLRQEHPGKYENKVNPVPNPDEWFHVKIIVAGKRISVFVDNADKPCLEVEKLTPTTKGSVGLWVGNGANGSFSNLKITHAPTQATSSTAIKYGDNPSAGNYFNTGDAKLYYAGRPVSVKEVTAATHVARRF